MAAIDFSRILKSTVAVVCFHSVKYTWPCSPIVYTLGMHLLVISSIYQIKTHWWTVLRYQVTKVTLLRTLVPQPSLHYMQFINLIYNCGQVLCLSRSLLLFYLLLMF